MSVWFAVFVKAADWSGWDDWRVLGDGWYKPQDPAPLHPATEEGKPRRKNKR